MKSIADLAAAGPRDTKTVMAKMREMPVRDAFTDDGVLRPLKDGGCPLVK